jgi:hypothetical protein
MEQEQKKQRGGARQNAGRKVTPYKVPLNVRITQEAADIMARHPNKREVVDQLIKEYLK